MDLSAVYRINTDALEQYNSNKTKVAEGSDMFSVMLNSAIDNINTTNAYLSDAENEEIKFALGETESTHDLMISLQE